MAMSWHMMVEFEPPLLACVVSEADFSFLALRKSKECVIAILVVELVFWQIGNCSGRNVQKFAKFGLTPRAAERVAPPLIAECFANLECRVIHTRLVNKYDLFMLEARAVTGASEDLDTSQTAPEKKLGLRNDKKSHDVEMTAYQPHNGKITG